MKLTVEQLESRDCPAYVTVINGSVENDQVAYQPFAGYTGSVHASLEETSVLGQYTVYAVGGRGGGPRLQIAPFQNGVPQPTFDQFVLESTYRDGLNIATGDVTGDGIPDIVIGTQNGGGPRCEIFDGSNMSLLANFFAYDSEFRGGLNVAIDPIDHLVYTCAGVGGSSNVRVFDMHGNSVNSFFGGDPNSRTGGQVAVGDFYGTLEESVAVLSDGKVRVFSPNGLQEGSTVGVPDAVSIGVGYETQQLVPYVEVTTSDNRLLELDTNVLFSQNGGRVVSTRSLDPSTTTTPSLSENSSWVGTVHQLDGLARYSKTGGLLGTNPDGGYQTYDASTLLGSPQTSPVGASAIGNQSGGTGTLTGYVQLPDGTFAGLSNRHVVADVQGNAAIGTVITQPGPYFKGGVAFGTVKSFTPVGYQLNDSSLITLNSQSQVNFNYGYTNAGDDTDLKTIRTNPVTATVHPGDIIYKFGFWGTARGIVIAVNQTVQVNDEGRNLTYTNQVLVASAESGVSWIIPGDSGSLVVDLNGDWVGQVFAGSTVTGIFSPIQTVLNSLGVSP